MREYRILHLEDSQIDADVIKGVLLKGNLNFQYFFVDDKESFIRGLTDFKPDVILCDHALPQFDSVMAFDIYKEMKFEIPFILVTGAVSEEYAVEMIKKGIDDYLLKTNLQRLPQAIKSAVDKRENEKKIRQVEKDLKQSETNLRTIFENTSSGFLLLDKNLNVISFNNQMSYFVRKAFGFDLQQNVNLIDIMPEREQEFKNLFSMILKGEAISNETSYPQTDGKLIWYSIKGNPVMNQERNIAGVCLTIDNITERKNTEENLKQSENRFRELFESAPEGLVVVDNTTFTFVKFNANAAKLFKYSAEEFIKKGLLDISPLFQPDGRSSEEKAKELMINLMKGDNPVFEWLIVDANGKEIICEVRLTLLSNSNGSQHLGSFIDITERKQSEKALLESEFQFRTVADFTWDWEFWMNQDRQFVYVSPSCERISGYRREEFMESGYLFLDIVYPDDIDAVKGKLAKAFMHETETGFDFRIVRRDGEARWLSLAFQPITDPDGTLLGVRGSMRDVTGHKLAEEERFRLSSILEATSDFVGIADANQQIVYFNRAGRKRMGYGLKEDLSRTKITDYSPAWANEIIIKKGLAVALKTGKWMGETAFLTKEGVEIPVSQVIIAHKNASGELMFLSTICRDITFQKEMTEKLKIQNKKLYEIAFLQSHQVRGPIASILGLISLFNYDNPNDPINTIVITNLQKTTVAFDEIIHEIVQKTNEIEESK